MGSYIGDLVSKWGHILSGERKQLLAAGAGAGLAAAFAAPLAAATLVIESIERFDAPKTAITTILAGVVAGAIASTIFPINPYHDIQAFLLCQFARCADGVVSFYLDDFIDHRAVVGFRDKARADPLYLVRSGFTA